MVGWTQGDHNLWNNVTNQPLEAFLIFDNPQFQTKRQVVTDFFRSIVALGSMQKPG